MTDWEDATDPVQPKKRELSEAERRRRIALRKEHRHEWLRPGAEAASTYHIDKDFDERF